MEQIPHLTDVGLLYFSKSNIIKGKRIVVVGFQKHAPDISMECSTVNGMRQIPIVNQISGFVHYLWIVDSVIRYTNAYDICQMSNLIGNIQKLFAKLISCKSKLEKLYFRQKYT